MIDSFNDMQKRVLHILNFLLSDWLRDITCTLSCSVIGYGPYQLALLLWRFMRIMPIKQTRMKGNVLFHVILDAGKRFVLKLVSALHDEVGVITPQIMKNDGYSTGELKVQVARIVSGTSKCTSEVTVISHSISTKLFSANNNDKE